MKINRTREEWHSIFDAHSRSGLSQNEFCRKRGITRSAFSNAKQRIAPGSVRKPGFVPVLPPQPFNGETAFADTVPTLPESASDKAVLHASQPAASISLFLSGAILNLPADISPCWLATLLREMAP